MRSDRYLSRANEVPTEVSIFSPFRVIICKRGAGRSTWVLMSGNPILIPWKQWLHLVSDILLACQAAESAEGAVPRQVPRAFLEQTSRVEIDATWELAATQLRPWIPQSKFSLTSLSLPSQAPCLHPSEDSSARWLSVARDLIVPGLPIEHIDPKGRFTLQDYAKDNTPPAFETAPTSWTPLGVGIHFAPGGGTLPGNSLVQPFIDPGGRWITQRAEVQLVIGLSLLTDPPPQIHFCPEILQAGMLRQAIFECIQRGFASRRPECHP